MKRARKIQFFLFNFLKNHSILHNYVYPFTRNSCKKNTRNHEKSTRNYLEIYDNCSIIGLILWGISVEVIYTILLVFRFLLLVEFLTFLSQDQTFLHFFWIVDVLLQ